MPSPRLRLGCKNPNPTIPDDFLTAKVVASAAAPAPCGAVLYRKASCSRTQGKAVNQRLETGMKTFHEWLRERQKLQEVLLLGSDGRLKGMSPANPLPKDSAFNKSLKQKPKPPPSGAPVFKPWKPAQTGTVCEGRDAVRILPEQMQ